MVNIQAKTREEYFKLAGEREPILRQLDAAIRDAAPHLEATLSGGMSGMWLAYGMQPYQSKSMKEPGEWPVVALANQKNYVSLYIMAVEDGGYMAEKYKPDLGKVSIGRSCIRFKKLEDLNIETVKKMLAIIDQRFAAGESLYGNSTR